LSSNHNQIPKVITVDKNAAYPPAINELKNDKILPKKRRHSANQVFE